MPKRFTIRRTAVIPAPIDAVYAVIAAVEQYPEFLPGVRAVRRRGHLVEMTVDVGPLTLTWLQRATFEPPTTIAFVQVDGPFRLFRGGWRLTPAEDGTRVAYETEFELGLLLPGLDRIVEQALAENVERTIAAFQRRLAAVQGEPDARPRDESPA